MTREELISKLAAYQPALICPTCGQSAVEHNLACDNHGGPGGNAYDDAEFLESLVLAARELVKAHPDAPAYRDAAKMLLEQADFDYTNVPPDTPVIVNPTGSGAQVLVYLWVEANDTDLPLCAGCRERRRPADNRQFCETCLPPEASSIIGNMTRPELEDAHYSAHGIERDELVAVTDEDLRARILAAFGLGHLAPAEIGLPRRRSPR